MYIYIDKESERERGKERETGKDGRRKKVTQQEDEGKE
jgi:hypothetical protein